MRIASLAAAMLVAAVICGGAAAEDCSSARSANNPAFGTPRSCATSSAERAPVASRAPTTKKKPDTVTKESGATVYRWGETSVAVGGYVAVDTTTGKGKLRP